jgi:gluconolactonase
MSIRLTLCLVAALLLQSTSMAQEPQTIGKIERCDLRFDSLMPTDAQIEVLGSGIQWAEGPVWVPRDGGFLLFSDVRAGRIMKWKEGEGLSVFLTPSGYTGAAHYSVEPGSNGLVLDPQGRLVCCEHGDRRISVMDWDGGKVTLADHYQGKRFNSPNDAVYDSSGALYFTDPPYGLPQQENDPHREIDFCGVYRVAPDGTVTLVTDEMTRPNGIGISPDEKTLYVAQSDGAAPIIRAFDLQPDGSVTNSRVFYDASADSKRLRGMPDGMTIDAAGNLFATGPGGVLVISPEGELLGRLATGVPTANCTWGDDGSTLYITANTQLCRVRTTTKGTGW